MPLTIVPGSMKYKDSNGEYQEITGLRGETGPQGPAGPRGETGSQGPRGETGSAGPQGVPGVKGETGDTGTTFTPAVSSEGVISWTNDGGKANPSPVSIKGPKGDKGDPGETPIDDTAGAGDTTKVWSANKSYEENQSLLSAINALDHRIDAVEIHETVSTPASVMTIADGADDIPVDELVVGIEPVQSGSGDPAPDNVRPISGWTGVTINRAGKNLFNIADAFVGTGQSVSGTTISKGSTAYNYDLFNGTTGSSAIAVKTMYLKAGTYTISGTVTGEGTLRGFAVDENGATADSYLFGLSSSNSPRTFTVPNDTRFTLRYSNQNENTVTDLQIEFGSTASAYTPYDGETCTVLFPTEAGTVYGGTLTIHKNGTGTLVVDRKIVSINGTENWNVSSADNHVFQLAVTGNDASKSSENISSTMLNSGVPNVQSPYFYVTTNNLRVVNTAIDATAEAIKAWFAANPCDFCIFNNTAVSYELTALEVIETLKGTNNIWADTGAIQSMTYSADPKMYVDQHSVSDVQVNGTSVVTDGVANVPIASASTPGVAKVDINNGIFLYQDSLTLNISDIKDTKEGYRQFKPLSPFVQHASAFYGLAKAAGDSTQSASSNAVGTYTDAAKKAICAMLGVKYEEPFRLIKEITISEETSGVYVNSDTNNNPFSLQEIIIHISGLVATGNGSLGIGVNIGQKVYQAGKTFLYVADGCKMAGRSSIESLKISGGKFFGQSSGDDVNLEYSTTSLRSSTNAMGIIDCNDLNELYIGSVNNYKFTSGTITIYGR